MQGGVCLGPQPKPFASPTRSPNLLGDTSRLTWSWGFKILISSGFSLKRLQMAFWDSSLLLFRWAFMVFLLCSSPLLGAPSSPCDDNDLQALQWFAGNLTGKAFISNGWFKNESCCSWDGVSCAGDRVTMLQLSGWGLAGLLSSSLANLDRLRSLDLSRNRFSGHIPSEISGLNQLELLDLSYNEFSGPITMIGDIASLRWANLSSNSFNGSLGNFGILPNLVAFNISNNSLAGPISSGVCIGSNVIQVVDLSANSLSGELAGEGFANCCNSLRELYIGSNSLTGNLPDQLFDLVAVEKLSIAFNGFSGQLSDRLNNLPIIRTLIISGNQFSGPLPDVFENTTSLEHFLAHSNLFSGKLPPSLASCSMLRELDLHNNSFSGSIDIDFSRMPLLSSLDLASNHFNGTLPASLSNCQDLKTLSVAKNSLSGQIPGEFANLVFLSFLSLSNNSFHNLSGALSVLQGNKNLITLILTKNFHGEEVPQLPGAFENLRILAVGNCALKGQIPLWLKECKDLEVLDLSWNCLSGAIPPWIGGFENLFYLDISNNSLTGEIPKSLTQLRSLTLAHSSPRSVLIGMPLYVKRNQSIRGLQYNQLSSFPPSLYLNDNGLNGTIWPEFGHLKALHVLDLSNNHLTGTIPDTLSRMENLEVLDLSCNNLSGLIPSSLSKLTFLSKFSVANNHLQGTVPTGGQFFSFPNSSFQGNTGLCRTSGPSCNELLVPNPEIPSSLNNKVRRSSIVGIIISIGVGITILLAVVLLNLSRKDTKDSLDEEDVEDGTGFSYSLESKLVLFFQSPDVKELTICDLLKSTNNFDQANIIGCGGFGLVYKACLPDGTKAAIKRLSGDCGQIDREFQAEVEALSRAQHRNLVSLKGYCRHGSDRLLIYSYMENGSLDYWLHERMDEGSLLNWEYRLKIAQGAARGLAYLHKVCEPNIVHRDVKSSNILLDERFEAHLADFGLSRLIHPYDTHVTTDLVGTLGYIPPEYSQTLTATLKGDVFSFGVVLLELLTSRRPVDVCKAKECRDLVSWVLQKKSAKMEEQIFDPLIWSKTHEKQLLVVLETACKCISRDPRHRPSIEEVVSWLDGLGAAI